MAIRISHEAQHIADNAGLPTPREARRPRHRFGPRQDRAAAAARARRPASAAPRRVSKAARPIYRRLPKRGFNKPNALDVQRGQPRPLQQADRRRQLDAAQPVTAAALLAAGIVARAARRRAPSRQGRAQGQGSSFARWITRRGGAEAVRARPAAG
jgi:hypothetical protein